MKYSLFFAALLATMTFLACGKSDQSQVDAEPSTSTEQAQTATTPAATAENGQTASLNMEQAELQNKMRGYSGNIASVTPLGVDQIKELMPTTLSGLFVYENEGETSMALGAPATFVVAIYREEHDILKVAVTDSGGSPSTILAAAQWSNQNISKNSEKGFDRTTTYRGHPAREKYNNQTKVGVFEYIIDHRYIVSCQGKNITIEQMRAAMDELNLERLKSLKPIKQ